MTKGVAKALLLKGPISMDWQWVLTSVHHQCWDCVGINVLSLKTQVNLIL
jgi:hypothetical protein